MHQNYVASEIFVIYYTMCIKLYTVKMLRYECYGFNIFFVFEDSFLLLELSKNKKNRMFDIKIIIYNLHKLINLHLKFYKIMNRS